MSQLPLLDSASSDTNTLGTVLELLKVLNDKLDVSNEEVKALRSEVAECKENSEATYSQLQEIQTVVNRSVAQNGLRGTQMNEMNDVLTDMARVVGLFTIGIKGVDGMRKGIVQQFSSAEKSNATRNSCKLICVGVVKACYQAYVTGKNANPTLSMPEKLLNTLVQSGVMMRADTRKKAGHMLLGDMDNLDRQDINYYLEMLQSDEAREITNAVDNFMELLRGPMRIFVDEPLYKVIRVW